MVQVQRSSGSNRLFYFSPGLKQDTAGRLVFTGAAAQGNTQGRFVYLDIGTYAGQKDSAYGRRLKVPLKMTTSCWIILAPVRQTDECQKLLYRRSGGLRP